MAKHRALISGRNRALVNLIFKKLSDKLELYTTTMQNPDFSNHFLTLKPEMLIFCPQKESMEDTSALAAMRENLVENNAKLILAGNYEECLKIQAAFPMKADAIVITDKNREEDLFLGEILTFVDELMPVADEQKRRILVVDDDALMLKVIKEQIKDRYDVATAINGKTALKFLDVKDADLIVLDYEMPEMNGPQVLNALRERKRTQNIPVIFLTGTKDREKVREVLMMKPQGYLLKPVDRDKLIEMIETLLG